MRYGPHDFPPLPAGTTTQCGSPYALIKRGGAAPGKRPFTKLAFITHISSPDGGRTLVIRGLIKQGNGWTKRPGAISERDVIAQWRTAPSPATIAGRRRALKVESI